MLHNSEISTISTVFNGQLLFPIQVLVFSKRKNKIQMEFNFTFIYIMKFMFDQANHLEETLYIISVCMYFLLNIICIIFHFDEYVPKHERTIRYVLSFIQIPMVERRPNSDSRTSVIFSLKNQIGGLARALQVFQVWFHYSYLNIVGNITETIASTKKKRKDYSKLIQQLNYLNTLLVTLKVPNITFIVEFLV